MNESRREANPGDAATTDAKRSSRWIVAGTILWGLVLIAAYGIIISRKNSEKPHEAELPVIRLDDNADSGSRFPTDVDTTPAVEKTPPKTPWNPDGIEDFALTERNGRTITKQDLLGHDWIVGFVFINCAGPCPRVSTAMHELQRDLKETDVRLLTITVDPKTDTPERLRKYAEVFSADPERWLFLTGDPEKVYKLIHASFQTMAEEATGEDRKPGFEVAHETNLLHLNAKGVVVGKYNALDGGDMAKLRRVLKAK